MWSRRCILATAISGAVAAALAALASLGGFEVKPLAGAEPPASQPASQLPQKAVTILGPTSLWRWHFTWKTEAVRRNSGELEFGQADWSKKAFVKAANVVATEPPGKNWTAIDFDDSSWPRGRGPMSSGTTLRVALISARVRFEVADPANLKASDLTFSLGYRGGAVVCLNGQELARQHLPKEGLQWDTPAEDYPREAYVSPEGFNLNWVGFGDPEKHKDRFALRHRKLDVQIPAATLRKGINVLAVEVHRAPAAEVMFSGKFNHESFYAHWSQAAVESAAMTVPVGGGVVPNVGQPRPAGVQVWSAPMLPGVRVTDFADPSEPIRPVRIHGTRNGTFSGQFVVGADQAIKGLTVTPADLKQATGATIPASAVRVRYALGGLTEEMESPAGSARFDGLKESPPAEVAVTKAAAGAIQPIWLSVSVPKDAHPGDYTGRATVSAAGGRGPQSQRIAIGDPSLAAVDVPITLTVADWTLPEPRDYTTFIGFIQSPESVALQYKVDMWSDQHWKLIERSFELLGRIGTKDVYIPIRAKTYFGNEYSMVRWVKQPDGAWKHDFSIVEKYLDTALKHLGKVPAVVIYAWDVDSGSSYMGGGTAKIGNSPMPFTVLDAATGKLENQDGPKWGEPQMRPFLQPVFDGLRKILADRGLSKSMMVGLCGDRRPGKDAVEDLKAVAPEAPWVMASHTDPDNVFGQPIGMRTVVWGQRPAPDPADKRIFGWRNPQLRALHPRYGSTCLGQEMTLRAALGVYREAPEMALTAEANLRGIGRCGGDFWPVFGDKRGFGQFVVGRYPATNAWHGGDLLNESYPYSLWPGKDGPIATTRFEMLREGVQEEEARIFLEKILGSLDPPAKARLGDDLAKRCQDLLDERVRANRWAIDNGVPLCSGGGYMSWVWFAGSGWEDRVARLYALAGAAEAAGKIVGK